MEEMKDYIAFEVNETLYFERGQEISEMISISLDPDISLQKYESYIQIRGVILLNGEYKRAHNTPMLKESNHETTSYIEKIMDKNETDSEFNHRFPLDISIPNDRVNDMEDVGVSIEAFDYELPDHHTLKIKAMIHIDGLLNNTEKNNVEQEEEIGAEETVQDHDVKEVLEKQEENIQEEVVQEDLEEGETTEVMEPSNEKPKVVETVDSTEIDILLSESKQEEEEEQVKDVQFLTDLFGGMEEEYKATITIYITQEEDTVESIAKRFQIPAVQLLKDNNLSGETITEGQLLHITRE